MLNAKEASKMLETMSPEERLKALQNKVSVKTKNILDKKIRETIAGFEKKVEITLNENLCRDPDENIEALLRWLWYKDVDVTSDFPAYSESYAWTTTIKFKIP